MEKGVARLFGRQAAETAAERAAREAAEKAAKEKLGKNVSKFGKSATDAADNAPIVNIVNQGASASTFSKFTNAVKAATAVGALTGGAVLTANLLDDAEKQKGECKEVCSAGQLPLEGVEPNEDGTTTKMQCNQWLDDESNEATDQEKLTECCNSFCDDKYKASAVIGQELGEMGAVAGNVAADVGGGVGSGLAEGLTGGEAPDLLGIGEFGDQLKIILIVICALLLITNVVIPMIAAFKGGGK